MKDIIFNEDFNEEEIIERFRAWVKEEHAKRATKKNRLFYVTTHDDFIEFGKTQLMAGFTPPLWMGHNQWEDLHQKYVDTVKKCIEILHKICEEEGTTIMETPTGGLAKKLIVCRK